MQNQVDLLGQVIDVAIVEDDSVMVWIDVHRLRADVISADLVWIGWSVNVPDFTALAADVVAFLSLIHI